MANHSILHTPGSEEEESSQDTDIQHAKCAAKNDQPSSCELTKNTQNRLHSVSAIELSNERREKSPEADACEENSLRNSISNQMKHKQQDNDVKKSADSTSKKMPNLEQGGRNFTGNNLPSRPTSLENRPTDDNQYRLARPNIHGSKGKQEDGVQNVKEASEIIPSQQSSASKNNNTSISNKSATDAGTSNKSRNVTPSAPGAVPANSPPILVRWPRSLTRMSIPVRNPHSAPVRVSWSQQTVSNPARSTELVLEIPWENTRPRYVDLRTGTRHLTLNNVPTAACNVAAGEFQACRCRSLTPESRDNQPQPESLPTSSGTRQTASVVNTTTQSSASHSSSQHTYRRNTSIMSPYFQRTTLQQNGKAGAHCRRLKWPTSQRNEQKKISKKSPDSPPAGNTSGTSGLASSSNRHPSTTQTITQGTIEHQSISASTRDLVPRNPEFSNRNSPFAIEMADTMEGKLCTVAKHCENKSKVCRTDTSKSAQALRSNAISANVTIEQNTPGPSRISSTHRKRSRAAAYAEMSDDMMQRLSSCKKHSRRTLLHFDRVIDEMEEELCKLKRKRRILHQSLAKQHVQVPHVLGDSSDDEENEKNDGNKVQNNTIDIQNKDLNDRIIPEVLSIEFSESDDDGNIENAVVAGANLRHCNHDDVGDCCEDLFSSDDSD